MAAEVFFTDFAIDVIAEAVGTEEAEFGKRMTTGMPIFLKAGMIEGENKGYRFWTCTISGLYSSIF